MLFILKLWNILVAWGYNQLLFPRLKLIQEDILERDSHGEIDIRTSQLHYLFRGGVKVFRACSRGHQHRYIHQIATYFLCKIFLRHYADKYIYFPAFICVCRIKAEYSKEYDQCFPHFPWPPLLHLI